MGKQRRRKRQSNNNSNNGKKKNNSNHQQQQSSPEHSSTLLQRIRHSDPRTRHAALAAVANTLLDPSTSSHRLPKAVSSPLLQAIRERVLDSDLDVSQVAAGCLANYVQIIANTGTENGNEATQSQGQSQTMTAGWTLVLMGRLKQCHENVVKAVVSQQQQQPAQKQPEQQGKSTTNSKHSNNRKKKASNSTNNNSNNNNSNKVHKQWLALAVQCLRTLCVLTETNPEAVGRLTSQLDATPRRDFHQILLEWIQHCHATLLLENNQKPTEMQPYLEQIMTLSARTLHSAWDDNQDLLLPWKEECPDAFRHALELLEAIVKPSDTISASTSNSAVPVVAQLHCAGAILTARPFMTTQQAAQVTQQTVLPQLLRQSTTFSWDTARSILQAYQQALTAWEQEQADDAMERDVIRKVEDRKEPARLIARRQKQQKEQQEASKKQQEQAMEEEDNNDSDNKKDGKKEAKEDDDAMDAEDDDEKQAMETREALEQARDAWNQFLLPLQLSLELLANLTSRNSLGGDEEEEDMMMMDDDDWGPDQEAKWMQQEEQRQMQTSMPSSTDDPLQKILVDSALPQQLRQLFGQVYQSQQQQEQALSFPEKSLDDMEDLQSKTMACLGNCWENISSWPVEVSWPELQKAATTATGAGKEGLVSAMVIALKTYPSLRKQWQPEHVSFWLTELEGNHRQEEEAMRRDIICMLGILCSQEPHPAEVNQKICSALLTALTKGSTATSSPMIPCEVLNMLMDMYGNDEDDGCCHVSVFESLQVLGHFQRSIPALKSKLKQLEKNKKNVDRADLEQWKETVLNANRFVQYKKGQL